MNSQTNTAPVSILIPLPKRNPLKVAAAAWKALRGSSGSWINSPRKAPNQGPRMIPKGPRKRLKSVPTVAPRAPAFVPPARLVNQAGATLSKRLTPMVTSRQMIKVSLASVLRSEKRARSSPAQAKGSPGRTGRKLPRKPISSAPPATIRRRRSPSSADHAPSLSMVKLCFLLRRFGLGSNWSISSFPGSEFSSSGTAGGLSAAGKFKVEPGTRRNGKNGQK